MIKYTIILMNMLALVIMRMFFAGDVTVKMNVPAQVKPGQEFTVSLIINKGSIAGVGHMKQELPAGFGEATVIEAKGAEFKYLPEDNIVKFTWISLPAEAEFTVSYKIKVIEDCPEGSVPLMGKFSYVLNNEKQTFIVPEVSISVKEKAAVLATTTTTTQPDITATTTTSKETTSVTTTVPETVATTTTEKETTTTTTQPDITATTTTPKETTSVTTTTIPETVTTTTTEKETTTTTQPDITATTTTPKETTSVTTTAPETVVTTTTTTETKTAELVAANRTIVGSPEAGTEFTVEINVQKDGMKGFARIQEILPTGLTAVSFDNQGGTFSFIDQKVKIIWDNLPADENVKISYRVLVSDNASGPMSISGTFSYVDKDDPKKAEIPSTTIYIKGKTTFAATDAGNSTENKNTTTTATTGTENQAVTTSTTTTVPQAENQVAYKVQICALSKMQRGTSYFENKFAIADNVSMEFHEGWRKYIVGKYSQYKDARDYRESIRAKGVENPFVTAYNSGKRITVQEALMVSNQQWVR